jgi:hypothetical protein
MLLVHNRTPFATQLYSVLDRDGIEHAVVAIKGTFRIGSGDELTIAEEQAALVAADVHHGAPEASSLQYESDLCPAKPGTDVALLGHAYPTRDTPHQVDVTLRAGRLRKTVRVLGPRAWYRAPGGRPEISEPKRFERMPLRYEHAFGGADTSPPDPSQHGYEPRNPVGAGFVAEGATPSLDELRLPNLEDPEAPIQAPTDRPAPAGFGLVHRCWQPRAALGGTYDQRWLRQRAPLLPLDFDARFHQAGAAGLVSPEPLRGGEPLSVSGACPGGATLTFRLPVRLLEAKFRIGLQDTSVQPSLDTVLIEPDHYRVLLTWHASLRCPRQFLQIDRVRVQDGAGP